MQRIINSVSCLAIYFFSKCIVHDLNISYVIFQDDFLRAHFKYLCILYRKGFIDFLSITGLLQIQLVRIKHFGSDENRSN